MAVAVYHHAESGGFGLQVELAEIVQHVDRNAAGFDNFGFGQSARPGRGVNVAANRGYGRDLRERFQNFGSADIAGVEDAVGSAQSLRRLRAAAGRGCRR
jgi:hypothetical protein